MFCDDWFQVKKRVSYSFASCKFLCISHSLEPEEETATKPSNTATSVQELSKRYHLCDICDIFK